PRPAPRGMLAHPPQPAAGHRPGGLAGAPKFSAGVEENPPQLPPKTVVNIYRSATGRVVGSIRPPKPYHDFTAVSRLGGDRSFVAAPLTALSPTPRTPHLFPVSIHCHGPPPRLPPPSAPPGP